MEDWVFGGGTQSALLTFQAARPSRHLPPLLHTCYACLYRRSVVIAASPRGRGMLRSPGAVFPNFQLGTLNMAHGPVRAHVLRSVRRPQACADLPETGVADEATWRALLGPDLTPLAPDALSGAGPSPPSPPAAGSASELSSAPITLWKSNGLQIKFILKFL